VHCSAKVTPEVPAGTVACRRGCGRKARSTAATANALVPDSLTDIAGGACFNDARVQVELLGRH
jgi:anaerobic selenocysteine-containing dehydrogenase